MAQPAAHKPLGGDQVARKIIYRAMSDFRRKRRSVEPYEPMPEDRPVPEDKPVPEDRPVPEDKPAPQDA